MPTLVLATRNRKKRHEVAELLADMPVTLGDLNDRPTAPEVEETGGSFVANATLKAVGVARALGEWSLADDSGLVVPALNGEPGVDSALYAGGHGDDAANNRRLVARLAEAGLDRTPAYYVCVLVLAGPDGEVRATAEGHCRGVVVADGRGVGGFGYDPHFLIPECHATFGELSPAVKRALSHRARAVAAMRPALWRWLGG